ncbi:MAG: NAD(P)/FAD-dependent oxidoreductase [Deltaproteobacteria bacterium]|nr:MAG: NAD(P)/FAD-dependent oxidoreductase [Deltaproteobacteria bacterium]
MPRAHDFDVAIVGGGLAGGLLARQLRLAAPDLSIAVFERRREGGYKVGESTVEIAANYLARKVRLNRYLVEHHLFKNGLRYFFDTEKKDGSLFELSEIGTDGYPYHPSFQIDRARFDRDLRAMNREMGVAVFEDVAVRDPDLSDGNRPHAFDVEDATGHRVRRTCRWFVDATGRARLLARTRKEAPVPVDLPIASVWGRATGIESIDDLGPEAFRARVRHTSRFLSTNHFCYPGYWIWFIPLRDGIVSIGVVGHKDVVTPALQKQDAFAQFLRSHKAVDTLLGKGGFVDLMGYRQLAYGTRGFYEPNRVVRTGESAAFSDPFYSPGSDFIATENDQIADLVLRDHAGEDAPALAERIAKYDRFMQYRFDTTIPIYRQLYETFGSFALMRAKYAFDVSTYYNVWVHAYMLDLHLDTSWIDEQLRAAQPTMTALDNVRRMFRDAARRLMAEGRYFAENLGGYYRGQEPILDLVYTIGLPRKRKEILRRLQRSLWEARRDTLAALGDPRAGDLPPEPLFAFMTERDLLAANATSAQRPPASPPA